MSSAARSVVVFGAYLGVLGVSLVLVPGIIVPLVGLPPPGGFWIRVVGVLLLIIAYADIRLGREEVTAWFRASVHMRFAVLVFFAAFVLLGLAPPMLAVFGVVDLVGALWTAAALRSDRNGTAPTAT